MGEGGSGCPGAWPTSLQIPCSPVSGFLLEWRPSASPGEMLAVLEQSLVLECSAGVLRAFAKPEASTCGQLPHFGFSHRSVLALLSDCCWAGLSLLSPCFIVAEPAFFLCLPRCSQSDYGGGGHTIWGPNCSLFLNRRGEYFTSCVHVAFLSKETMAQMQVAAAIFSGYEAHHFILPGMGVPWCATCSVKGLLA
eukprot:1158071-Pelagomonas_calceolata.AAC.9